ncbi:MAG: site-specific integrase [Prevotellaceae bacterium]|jgi:site-specific recombinase XerD|nr:site-specific integrase [Prevotellaceae bacterium]
MAALSIYLQNPRPDGLISLSIKIDHRSQRRYIKTNVFCSAKDIIGKKLKKNFYSAPIERLLHTYRSRIADLGARVREYSADDIKKYLLRQDATDGGKFIDFIAFCDKRNEELKKEKGKNGTWYANTAAVGWLRKFEGAGSIDINDVTKRRLELFEAYMQRQGVGSFGINSYLRALRTLFLAAMDEYNNEAKDEYYIRHYPFRKFKIKEVVAEKRAIEIDTFVKILTCEVKTKREEIGRDMLFLSFLLAGISPIDLYVLIEPRAGYIEYYRDKVMHRSNKVKLKIPIHNKAAELIKKYSLTKFMSAIKLYASVREFSRACNLGLRTICERLAIERVTLYWARHTFSSIACELGYDTNLIDYVLGHAPSRAKMAELYITRRQKTIDDLVVTVTDMVVSKIKE